MLSAARHFDDAGEQTNRGLEALTGDQQPGFRGVDGLGACQRAGVRHRRPRDDLDALRHGRNRQVEGQRDQPARRNHRRCLDRLKPFERCTDAIAGRRQIGNREAAVVAGHLLGYRIAVGAQDGDESARQLHSAVQSGDGPLNAASRVGRCFPAQRGGAADQRHCHHDSSEVGRTAPTRADHICHSMSAREISSRRSQ